MSNNDSGQNASIKKEADFLLYQKGLHALLNEFGKAHVSGSYALDLMAWRDLDIYLETEHLSTASFFSLGSRICELLQPLKMHFRNELLARTEHLPCGLYWGIYSINEEQQQWKIDLWAVDPTECARLLVYCQNIKERLTPEYSKRILDIKSQCWDDPGYRRTFTSTDICQAVMEGGVTDLQQFRVYLANRRSNL